MEFTQDSNNHNYSESNNARTNDKTPQTTFDAPLDSVNLDMSTDTDRKDKDAKSKSDGKTDDIKKDRRPQKPKEEVSYMTHLTTLAHISVVVFTYLVLKLSFRGDFDLFTWHPILMGLGWMLLMTQGLYAINKYNTYWRFKTTGSLRVRIHWIALSIGYTLSIIGFLIVYINKNNLNKQHFVSWHGLFGFIAILSTTPPVLNGIVLLYKKELANTINRPKLIKFVHVLSGTLAFLFGSLALSLSVYTKWFGRRSNHSDSIFWLGVVSVSYPLFWAIFGPSVKLVRVVRDVIKEKMS